MTDEFRQRRHIAYATPASVLAEVVNEATGQDVVDHEQIVQGYANEVYRVGTQQGSCFIVRIHQHGGLGFAEEAWAMERCRATGAPVPEVYRVSTIALGGLPREVMILQRAPGRALSHAQATLTPEEQARVWAQVGAALGAIHSVRVGGFGPLHTDGRGEYVDWDSAVQAMFRERNADAPSLAQAGVLEAEIDGLLQLLAQAPSFVCTRPVLCLGDLGMDHLFVDDQLNLTGVIDFGQCQGGPPALDFAVLLIYHPEIDLAWLQRGYRDDAIFDETFTLQLLLHQANVIMGYLAADVRAGNTDNRAEILHGLRAILHRWRRIHAGAL